MNFIPYVAPYLLPAGYGAFAGLVLAGADQFEESSEGAAAQEKPNFFATLARNLVLGALSGPAVVGLCKLASWTFSLIPAGTGAAILTNGAAILGTAQAGLLALPLAAQIAIPVAIVVLVVGAVAYAVFNKANPEAKKDIEPEDLASSSSSEAGVPLPPPADPVTPETPLAV